MISPQDLRKNHVIRHQGELFKIIESNYHAGGGKLGGMAHVKMRNLSTGHLIEHRFASHEKIEDIETQRHEVDYLYDTKDECTFMNPATFEQITIPKARLGSIAAYLKEGMKVQVEFFEGTPIGINIPPYAEVIISSTAPGIKGETGDSTYKTAILENGMEILVPQFINTGDLIKVEVETGKYIERLQKK
jgi:elongation factor P